MITQVCCNEKVTYSYTDLKHLDEKIDTATIKSMVMRKMEAIAEQLLEFIPSRRPSNPPPMEKLHYK